MRGFTESGKEDIVEDTMRRRKHLETIYQAFLFLNT